MADSWSKSPVTTDGATLGQNALSLVLGAVITLGLFMGMARFANLTPEAPPPDIVDLRAIALPIEPPPPPRTTPTESEPIPMISTVTGFDLAPSDSPVKIAVSPPNLDTISPRATLAPPAIIQIGQLYGEFKPRADFATDVQHIYQRSEVDRIPNILYRAVPVIPQRYFKDSNSLRVSLLFVVEADGTITHVRVVNSSGNPEVDAIIEETVQKEWGFSPAIKKGRKVRCMLEQPFRVELGSGNPFQT